MGYHTSFAFKAPPHTVFEVLAEIRPLVGWLAEELTIDHQPDGTLAVGGAGRGERATVCYRTALSRSELKLAWHPVSGPTAWSGHAIVCGLPVGGSVIQVKLIVPAAMHVWIHQIDQVVSRLLRRLDGEAERRARLSAPGAAADLSEAA
jgi:hypothetical protein